MAAVGVALVLLTLMPGPETVDPNAPPPPADGETPEVSDASFSGKAAPLNYTLKDMNGIDVKLESFKGKIILLNFWATWCGPCREEMPLLDRVGSVWAGKGLQVVGVAIDDPEAVRRYLKDNPVGYPILVDGQADPDPSLLFGDTRSVLPYSVLIGRDGRLVDTRMGSFSQATLSAWLQPHL
jgi:thiol-disulfide isomerase/thioredoxin